MMALTVNLIGPSPWGFRIYGGRDFKKAITVSKVTTNEHSAPTDNVLLVIVSALPAECCHANFTS